MPVADVATYLVAFIVMADAWCISRGTQCPVDQVWSDRVDEKYRPRPVVILPAMSDSVSARPSHPV
ncbi:hypothetical protein [Kibdelosporangium aridum]|uniref:Uncharacterized protein n=1 Tax=Kibdelosporangium aridum TaxID=2030 RepID=A0A1W2FYZ1_KIBAR|nr:hypothetical protein [Kibdelosporangium aridum]SMD27150.1 hypothetical protein SAMN05661093_10747 [Kibdelosporangium aridum]